MKNKILILGILSLLLVSCSNQASKEIGFGHFEGTRYLNDYFGLQIEFPEAWSIQDRETIEAISKTGIETLAGDNDNLEAALNAAELQTVNLFAVFKFQPGAPVDFNPSIMCVAERLESMPGIKKGEDYLFHVKKLLNSTSIAYEFPQDIYTKTIDGIDFDVLTTQINVGVFTVEQSYCVTIMKGYALGMVVSYATEAEKSEMLTTLEAAEFNQSN